MKISVGLPVYDRKVDMQIVSCLLAETALAAKSGDELNVRLLPSVTNLAFGRNHIVKEFLASNDDRLVFLDADVSFEPGALLRIAKHEADFVGGAYRLKQAGPEKYPIHLLDHPTEIGPKGIIEVAMVPTGFLSLSRSVFTKFKEAYPNRHYRFGKDKTYCFFEIPYVENEDPSLDGALHTEDAYFCKMWRAIGGKVFLDPDLMLIHWNGNIPYPGHIGNWHKALQQIKETA